MDPQLIAMAAQMGLRGIGNDIGLIKSFGQSREAKRLDAETSIRPEYHIPENVTDVLDFTKSRASSGLSDATKQTYTQDAERGASMGIDAILKGGGNVNNIADLYGAYDSGISKMSVIDEQLRSQNVKNMMDANMTYADEKDKEWQLNTFDPWADKKQMAGTLHKQASDNFWKAFGGQVSAEGDLATALMYQNIPGQQPRKTPGVDITPIAADKGWSISGQGNPYSSLNNKVSVDAVRNRFPGLMIGSTSYQPIETYSE
jgi:hypothetical protein